MEFDLNIHPETPEQYVATTKDAERIIDTVIKPDLLVIDPFCEAALDAARKYDYPLILLSPNTIKEVASETQGLGIFFWPW
jgi:hypothetical protein